MVAVVYRATLPTGEQFILKICTRSEDYVREIYFLQHFAGILPVPRIIELSPPETGQNGAILMECLPGMILTELSESLAYEIGSVLARIHSNRTKGYGDLTQPETLNPDSRVYFTQKWEEGFSECSGHLSKALMEQCRGYYEAHVDLLSSVDGPCIIHRDFRPANLIVHNGKLQGIIDWASARAGFAEDDFCPMEMADGP